MLQGRLPVSGFIKGQLIRAHTSAACGPTRERYWLVSRFRQKRLRGGNGRTFSTPVAIAANVTYVVSYSAPNGAYAVDRNYSWSTLEAGLLHISGSSPGVYAYGSGNIFPYKTWASSNYWVDVVFKSQYDHAAPRGPGLASRRKAHMSYLAVQALQTQR